MHQHMSDSFLGAARARSVDAQRGWADAADAAGAAADAVLRELAPEVLSHLEAASLGRAACAHRCFYEALRLAVVARVERMGLRLDQPSLMRSGICAMWRVTERRGKPGCHCAWRRRVGWTAVLHRAELLHAEAHGHSTLDARWRRPHRGWSAREIVALNPTTFPGVMHQTVSVSQPIDLALALGTVEPSGTAHPLRPLRVWMSFGGTAAFADLHYCPGAPPRGEHETQHATARIQHWWRALAEASEHTFTFAQALTQPDEPSAAHAAVATLVTLTCGGERGQRGARIATHAPGPATPQAHHEEEPTCVARWPAAHCSGGGGGPASSEPAS